MSKAKRRKKLAQRIAELLKEKYETDKIIKKIDKTYKTKKPDKTYGGGGWTLP